jgi:acetate kinase
MRVLVLNAGSSSLKFDLFETGAAEIAANQDKLLGHGSIDRVSSMHDAFARALEQFSPSLNEGRADAVGHRVVHGGDTFHDAVLIDESVERRIEELGAVAPLHNPHNLEGIRAARAHFPNTKQVAVFDTAFHHTLPPKAYVYGLPYECLAETKIRRYGFHGISHQYVCGRFMQLQGGNREDYRLISCHLGNGCSVCAIERGKSIDTSMGFTPLEGLVMGTRSGDLDPAILDFIGAKEGLSSREVDSILNKQSGLLGVSGLTANMRELLAEEAENGDRRARLAIDVFCYRVRKYLGSYLAAMNGADAIVFAGGIGENSPAVRARICANLEWLGINVDGSRNAALVGQEGRMDAAGSRIELWVIPTDEELLIARDTWRVVSGADLRF